MNIPTSFDPIPWGFIFEVTMFFWIIFGLFVIELIVASVAPCFKWNKVGYTIVDGDVEIDKRHRVTFVALVLLTFTCWMVMIKSYLTLVGVVDEIFSLGDDFLADVSNNVIDNLVSINTTMVECFNETIGESLEIVNTFDEIDGQYGDIKSQVNDYVEYVDVGVAVLIGLLGALLVSFGVFSWYRYRGATCCTSTVVTVLAFVALFTMVLPASAIYYVIDDFCGSDVDKAVREVLGDVMGVGNLCNDDFGKYVCDYQSCATPTYNPLDDMAVDLLGQIPDNFTCTAGNNIKRAINETFEILDCENINGYYTRVVHGIVCTHLHDASLYFTIVPGLTFLLFGVILVGVGWGVVV